MGVCLNVERESIAGAFLASAPTLPEQRRRPCRPDPAPADSHKEGNVGHPDSHSQGLPGCLCVTKSPPVT